MVKCSPDTLETALLVTSRNKMFHSQRVDYWLSYGGTVADTSKLYKAPAKNDANKTKSVAFLDELSREGISFVSMGSRLVLRDVPKKHIAKFIASLDIHFENRKFDTDTLSAYIVDSKVFPRWDVTIATGSDEQMPWRVGGHEFPSAIRKCDIRREEDFIRVGMGNNRLIEPGIFSAGLTDEQLREIKARKRKDLTYSDYLNVDGRNPLLVLYPLSLKSGEERINETPYIGFAVGFPARGRSERTAYQASLTKTMRTEKSHEKL